MVIKFATSGATWWPYLQPMQVTANGGKICRFLSKRLLQSKTQLPRSACNVSLLGTPLSKNKKRGDFLPTNSMNFFLKHPLPTKHWRLTQVDINLSQRMLQEEGYENLESGISASRSYFSFLFRQRCFCSFLSSQLRLVQIFKR